MKKVALYSLVILMGLGFSELKAQTVSYGAKASANMTNFFVKDMDAESSMKVGASLGGFVKIDFNEYFALQPELMFSYKGSKMKEKSTGEKDNFEYWGVQIPVYAVGQMQLGTGRGYVGLGPYVEYGFSAKFKDADTDLYKKHDGEKYMNRFDFGLGCMVGYEFPNRIQINASYQMGLIDLLDAQKDNSTLRSQYLSLGVGYRF